MKKISFLALILLSVFSFAACSSSNPDNNNGGTGNDNPGSEYTVPTYEDYYVGFSDWNNRAKWNLANVHDPTVVLADDGYYYMYQTDASYGNVHEGHGHFFCRRSKIW
jgi:hypothetical protein